VPIPTVTEFRGDGGLFSTAVDYIRFEQMVLNDGRFNGTVVLSPKSIAAMVANQIGSLNVSALKTAMPERSSDFTFVDDGRDKWDLGFLITSRGTPGKRSAGSLSWGGINNTYFWIDRTRGVAGVIMMQFLPFADAKALAVYDAFERGAYEILEDVRAH
jgi:CubicO group peptidase (beta-lactamase class C family)